MPPCGKGKKKIDIKYIEDNRRRGVSVSKRKGGILKKVQEFYLLTRTPICVIIANKNKNKNIVSCFGNYDFRKTFINLHSEYLQQKIGMPQDENGNIYTEEDYKQELAKFGSELDSDVFAQVDDEISPCMPPLMSTHRT